MTARRDVIMTSEKDGRITSVNSWSMANDDPIRAGRLAEKARNGNKSAAKKLKKLEETKMIEIIGPNDEGLDI